MKFMVNLAQYEELKNVVRRFGYACIFDRRSSQESFVRRLGEGHYPRFHLYLEEKENNIIFSLHLDQKKASYEGQHMHSAEYDGDLVEGEIRTLASFVSSNGFSVVINNINNKKNRIKTMNNNQENNEISINKNEDSIDVLGNIEVGDLDRDINNWKKNQSKKSFFSIF